MDDDKVTNGTTLLIAHDTQMLAQRWSNVEPILSIESLLAGELLCKLNAVTSTPVCVVSRDESALKTRSLF